MKRILAVAPFAVALFAVPAPVGAQSIVYDKSEIRFVSKQMGVDVEGRFRRWKASVDLRAGDVAQSRADFDVDLASIDLASEESEAEVRRADWFDTARFPVASFRSSSVRSLGGDRYEVAGKLAMKGTTRDVVVPVDVRKDASGNTVAEARFAIKRLPYRIGDGPWSDPSVVADDVAVRVRIVLR
jgi:polyisoprenoid-binding protein YceI